MIEQLSEMVKYMPVEYKFVNLNDLYRNIARAAIYKAYKFIPDEKAWQHERLFPVFHVGVLDGRGQVVVENRQLNPAVRQIPAWFDISFVEYNMHLENISLQFSVADGLVKFNLSSNVKQEIN